MPANVILNPYSNRWNAGRRRGELEGALRKAGIDYKLSISERPGHIQELARQATLEGFSPILVAGGDGSIGEAINGLVQANGKGQLPPIGVLPMGSANDFAYNLKIPSDLGQAVQSAVSTRIQPVDLGQVNNRFFINNSGVGLEPYITLIQERIPWINGIPRYLIAAVRGIMDKPAWKARMVWDGGEYEGPISLVTIGNGPRSGGFYLSPHADPCDAKLSVVFGYRESRLSMLALLPKAFNPGPGSYVEAPGIQELDITHLEIRLNRPSPAHTDGEIFSKDILELEYSIHPGRVQLLLP